MAGIFRSLAVVIAVLPAPSLGKNHCENGWMDEEAVSKILDLVNTARQKLANGQQRNAGGDFLPPALYGLKNLTWNCNFENDLQSRISEECPNADDDYAADGIFFDYIQDMDKDPPLIVTPYSVQYSGQSYGKFMSEKTTTIGCIVGDCPTYYYLVCTSDSPVWMGDVIYTVTESTITATTATTATTSTSVATTTSMQNSIPTTTTMRASFLTTTTTQISIPNTTTMQTSTKTKKITTMYYTTTPKCAVTTTPKCVVTTTCRPARNQARAKREATAGNILKQTFPISDSQICPNNKEMTDTLRLLFLDMHNYRRLVLSLGKLKREGEVLPQAKNMMRLVYDCGLEEVAVNYAKRCPLTRPQKPGKVHLGENYYRMEKVDNASLVDAVVTAVDSWWKAGETAHLGPSVLFQKSYLRTPIKSFTQMAWATTKYLGCSVVDCQSSYVCVCNYSPRGNIVGKSVYKPGRSCTECGSGTTCEAEVGLCV